MNAVTKLNAEEACPFVGESLRILRQEVGVVQAGLRLGLNPIPLSQGAAGLYHKQG